jgi:hypothetical protein
VLYDFINMQEFEKAKQLADYWKHRRVPFSKGASESELTEFELNNQIHLPVSLKNLWQSTNGLVYDHELIRFWPLEELAKLQGVPPLMDYFLFADYLVESHYYAVHLNADVTNPAPTVWFYSSDIWCTITKSFDEFIDRYLNNYNSIIFPPELMLR